MPSLAEVRAELTGPGGMFEVTTEDVDGRPMQVYKERMRSLREITQELAERAGFTPSVAFECEDLETARAFVGAGLGVAVLPPPRAGERSSSRVRYLPLRHPRAVREIGLAWSTEHRMLPAAALFHEHVLARAREHASSAQPADA